MSFSALKKEYQFSQDQNIYDSEFVKYLKNPLTSQFFEVCNNQFIYFLWMDAAFATDFVLKEIKEVRNTQVFKRIQFDLNHLKNTFLWVYVHGQSRLYTLYELHSSFLGSKNKFIWGKEYDISFLSPSGPFKKLQLKDIINHEVFYKMLMLLMFEGKLQTREFRLRTKGNILCWFDDQEQSKYTFEVHQLSKDGILFKVDNEFYRSCFNTSQNISFLFDPYFLQSNLNSSLLELRENHKKLSSYPFYTDNMAHICQAKRTDVRIHNNHLDGEFKYLYFPFSKIDFKNTQTVQTVTDFCVELRKNLVRKIK